MRAPRVTCSVCSKDVAARKGSDNALYPRMHRSLANPSCPGRLAPGKKVNLRVRSTHATWDLVAIPIYLINDTMACCLVKHGDGLFRTVMVAEGVPQDPQNYANVLQAMQAVETGAPTGAWFMASALMKRSGSSGLVMVMPVKDRWYVHSVVDAVNTTLSDYATRTQALMQADAWIAGRAEVIDADIEDP